MARGHRKDHRAGAAMRLRHGRNCAYCGVRMTKSTDGNQVPTDVTRDHVIPKRYQGRKQVLACSGCNNLKGDMMPEEWLRFVIEHMPERAEAVRNVFRKFNIRWVEPRLDDSALIGA